MGNKKESTLSAVSASSANARPTTFPKDLPQLDSMLRNSFAAIKEEFDEHLQAINENTAELQYHTNYLDELDRRITKLEEKIDATHLMLKQLLRESRLNISLSHDEQKIFLILYTHEKFISAENIARKCEIAVDLVNECLASIQDKGIPILKDVLDGKTFYKLENAFKQRQAKENIIAISNEITKQYQNKLLNEFFSN
ncbi:hypothetical protein HZB03_01395 [Candidatus Woesearchaeota archaeon]|nr:hypothetical protein [Candidatus Woesearchaeota archaeon]